jgi:anti-sigma regulatory factor (Ser/Thr protein kinase)
MKTISEHVLDIVQNSVRAKATLIEIIVDEDNIKDIYALHFNDNGCGMDKETLSRATSPFFTSRTTRKVGMGLSLLKQNALASNGSFKIDSEPGKGTRVKAVFQLSHIDRPPAGDLWDTLYLILLSNPGIRVVYSHQASAGTFELDSAELMLMLNGVPLQQKEIKKAVIDLIRNNMEEIKASK